MLMCGGGMYDVVNACCSFFPCKYKRRQKLGEEGGCKVGSDNKFFSSTLSGAV